MIINNQIYIGIPEIVISYMQKHSNPKWQAELADDRKFNNILIIPAIQEYDNIRKLINSICENDQKYFAESLVLFVTNNTISSSNIIKNDNLQSLKFLRSVIEKDGKEELIYKINSTGLNIGLVDAATGDLELPEKDGGVGLARKIGMDLALSLFDYSNTSKKIMVCLDADCIVEKNYISTIVEYFNQGKISAAHIQFEHIIPEGREEKLAIICYEIFLRYYVVGLSYAGSPYSFLSVGSTMICDYETYIKVGGMNKRKAAEDFYFMEKLAKITEIKKIDATKVYPSGRISNRVPFGTGQRVNRFIAGEHEEYYVYSLKSFEILKQWNDIFLYGESLSSEDYLNKAKIISTTLYDYLILNSFKENWDKILSASKTKEQIHKQKITWFDGFKTLKLIHYLRDNGHPLTNMFETVKELLGRYEIELPQIDENQLPSIEIQTEYLRHLRNLS